MKLCIIRRGVQIGRWNEPFIGSGRSMESSQCEEAWMVDGSNLGLG